MKACVTTLKRRRSGSIARSEANLDSDVIRLGRATDCEVFLDDLRVSQHAARIFSNNGNIAIEATGETSLIANGQPTRVATLRVGDKFSLGPFDFEVVTPKDGDDIAIDYELARPIEEGEQVIIARSKMKLADTWLSRRGFAWAAFLIIIGALFVVPYLQIAGARNAVNVDAVQTDAMSAMPKPDDQKTLLDKVHMGHMWMSGGMSDSHKFLGSKCETCHQDAFEGVTNKACLSCHTEVENHADPLLFVSSSPQARGCTSCHTEHQGSNGILPQSQNLCTSCHADIRAVEPSSKLDNVSDFGEDHPTFRPTITIDPIAGTTARLVEAEDGTLSEQSNLKFSHAQHLRNDLYYPGTQKLLECDSCHVPELGGQTFRPIKMEGACDSCHKLAFDPNRPDRGLPHGDVEAVRTSLREFYQSIALEGSYEEGAVKTHGSGRRMIGGGGKTSSSSNVSGSPTTLKWARAKAKAAEELVFGGQACGTCHTVTRSGSASAPEWHVQPVKLNTNFFPMANFNHSKHEAMTCSTCHKAETSKASTELLLPGIETCQTCHAGDDAPADKVPSTCTKCHDFHVGDMQPMAGHNGMMHPFGTAAPGVE